MFWLARLQRRMQLPVPHIHVFQRLFRISRSDYAVFSVLVEQQSGYYKFYVSPQGGVLVNCVYLKPNWVELSNMTHHREFRIGNNVKTTITHSPTQLTIFINARTYCCTLSLPWNVISVWSTPTAISNQRVGKLLPCHECAETGKNKFNPSKLRGANAW